MEARSRGLKIRGREEPNSLRKTREKDVPFQSVKELSKEKK
jgi:hypothetical protein